MEDDEDMVFVPNVPRVSVRTRTHDELTIRMARDVSSPDDFAEEFAALASAREHDMVKLDIVSGGGSLDTCIMIRRAMAACDASIVGWIGPTCASAATAIALQCDGWEVDEMSSFMIHTGSFGAGRGKARDTQAYVSHQVQQIEKFIRLVYAGFLNEDEIELVLDGKELYFEGDELIARLEAFAEYRDKQENQTVEIKQDVLDEIEPDQ